MKKQVKRIDNGEINMEQRAGNAYLQASVQSASPARLRLMLINRALEITNSLGQKWSQDAESPDDGEVLRLLDILCELLSGVTGSSDPSENEACHKVADLYVFLTRHLLEAEENRNPSGMEQIAEVLRVESETWQLVCADEDLSRTPTQSTGSGLSFSA